MAPLRVCGRAKILVLGLALVSALPPVSVSVSGAPVHYRHDHRHRRLHGSAVLENEHWRIGASSTVLVEATATPNPRAMPEDDLPSVETTTTTRFVYYPLATPYNPDALHVEEEDEMPAEVFARISDRARALVRSSAYPPNNPVKAATGLFEHLASPRNPYSDGESISSPPYLLNEKLISPPSRVSNSAVVFFLGAVGFFFVSLIWNLYIRHVWTWDKVNQIDIGAAGAMRLTSLTGERRRGGTAKARRSPGGWLRAANEASAPVSVA
ncbi:hypothetical protein Z517_10797 [Fonsecaea pedrosoi CBS 271.37]|uniref:Uncharacterized protein n=1 Tax=Fonsecaea pedrosoi CBS 271.37 TaxID=1442368 RepID=A0A0D2ENW4_9EURO|nr:uncharacterized protein Z517_10797 [Fonsecaea pedrosoi CBS 271.37]KIW76052.1 hypothetical protein Z517_10797 [Fonsecaea pedrosoi CBS 271.37]